MLQFVYPSAARWVIKYPVPPPRNPGSLKRQKELARQQRQREKKAEREERRIASKDRPKPPPGVDPDIEGIIPGPQPIPEE